MRERIPSVLTPGKYWKPIYTQSYQYENTSVQIICWALPDGDKEAMFYVYLDSSASPILDSKTFPLKKPCTLRKLC